MNSAQLELGLDDVRLKIPWGGRSPRDLTRAGIALFLKRERQKDDRFFVDPDQVEFELAGKKGPPRYEGASLLIPLPTKEGGHALWHTRQEDREW